MARTAKIRTHTERTCANEARAFVDFDDAADCGDDAERHGNSGARNAVRDRDRLAVEAGWRDRGGDSAGGDLASGYGVAGDPSGSAAVRAEIQFARWRDGWLRRIL